MKKIILLSTAFIYYSIISYAQPPTISFESPSDNSSYDAPATIPLEALAEDAHEGGAINKVEFFNGDTLLANVTNSPYTFSWTNVPEGNYTLTAKATDNTGLTASSVTHVSIHTSKPTFGFTFIGTNLTSNINLANINNGIPDSSESAGVNICESGHYLTLEYFHSSPLNLYKITLNVTGPGLFVDNKKQAGDRIVTAAQLTATEGFHSISLANPNVATTVIETTTPFIDVDNNGDLSAGDITGDPIIITYALTPKLTWYVDADGDQHASEIILTCGIVPYPGWTLTRLPVDDCDDNDPTPCPSPIPPTANITTPANNVTYTAYGNIKIKLNATAADADGTISKVEFYSGNNLLHTEYVAPYDYVWHNVAVGDYTVTAKAYDNGDNVTISDAVHISVKPDIAPTVNITSPIKNASYTAYSNITLSADANDVDGTVKKVDFYNGSTLIFTETIAPFERQGYRLPLGNYFITAKATDNNGRVTTSEPVAISVVSNVAPVVSITSPANNTTYVSPATIILSADASDVDGTIKKVDFYKGNTLLFTENDAPYFRSWPDVPDGNYSITAIATDNNGRTTTSAPVAISVISASKSLAKEDKLKSSKEPLSLSLNPNPVANILNISAHGLQNNRSTISILSVSGAVIKTIQPSALNKNVQLDVSSLRSGVYFIKVINGDKVLYKQFVKL